MSIIDTFDFDGEEIIKAKDNVKQEQLAQAIRDGKITFLLQSVATGP